MAGVSVQLYSVRDLFAAEPGDTLRRLREIGFSQVEPYGVVQNAEVLRGLADYGLTAPTAHARLIGEDQREVFAVANECGIGVVIDPFVAPEKWQDAGDIAETAAAINSAAKVAAEFGVTVGYHNHWWELEKRIDGRSAFEVFADQLDPEVVLEVDTYWATAGREDAAALLGRLGERVHAIHVKDGGLAVDASGQLPAGQGQVPVADVLAAAKNALWVIEFDKYDGDLFDGIAASYAYLAEAGR
jgi:sugar phosphate isomerase/epimerase